MRHNDPSEVQQVCTSRNIQCGWISSIEDVFLVKPSPRLIELFSAIRRQSEDSQTMSIRGRWRKSWKVVASF